MASHPSREVEAQLSGLLDQVVDWLQFAESKNTGGVALTATALSVIVSFALFGPTLPTLARVGLGVGSVALMLSLLLTVASFLPSTNLEKHLVGERERPTARDNLLYYGHLARYEPRALVEALAELYFAQPGETYAPSKLAMDLAAQVVTNARITVRKFALYRAAVLLFGGGILIAAAAMALTTVME
jgi:hypothetical protein